MKNDEIRRANRQALPKFVALVILASIAGGALGYGAAKYGVNEMTGTLKSAGVFFGMNVAPWLMLAMAVALPAVCVPLYRRVKRMLGAWDGEDEDVSDAIDRTLSTVIWISSAALILSCFLIAASYSEGLSTFDGKGSDFVFFIGVAAFFSVMAEAVVIQQKCVDAAKQTNPEKEGSIYDMKFQKKWMDSCDEAEKLVIGKCAFKAYAATNMVCTVLAIVLALGALMFDIGFLPSFVVCLVWLVNLSAYCRESIRYSKAGVKLS